MAASTQHLSVLHPERDAEIVANHMREERFQRYAIETPRLLLNSACPGHDL